MSNSGEKVPEVAAQDDDPNDDESLVGEEVDDPRDEMED